MNSRDEIFSIADSLKHTKKDQGITDEHYCSIVRAISRGMHGADAARFDFLERSGYFKLMPHEKQLWEILE